METPHPLPFITVLVPCRNERAFIERCLDSIVNNGYPCDRLLVLVVDGMSADGTRTVLEAYVHNHEFVRVIDNQGGTTPMALNLGLRVAQGPVVCRVDAHACLAPGYLRRCVDALEEYGADVVCGVMNTVPSTTSLMGKAIAAALGHPFGVGNSYFRIHVPSPTWVDTVFCGCYRRDAFDRVLAWELVVNRETDKASLDSQGPFNPALVRGQDMDFSIRLRKAGGRMLLLPDISTDYYARSTIRSFSIQIWKNGVWAILPFAYSSGTSISSRHLAPLGFVLSVLMTAAAGLMLPAYLWVSAGIVGLYCIVNLAASVHVAWKTQSWPGAILMPFVFLTLHIAYGLGSGWGLVRLLLEKAFWRKLFGFGPKCVSRPC